VLHEHAVYGGTRNGAHDRDEGDQESGDGTRR